MGRQCDHPCACRMSIFDQVLAFIGEPESARFEALALAVFRFQFDSVVPYRRYYLERGRTPDSVASIDDIPPVSTIAFKYAELSNGAAQRVFLTSGTTIGAQSRGRHFVPRLEVYRASAMHHLARMLFPDRPAMRLLAMHPTADRMPESSLCQMNCASLRGNGQGGKHFRPACCDNDNIAPKGALPCLYGIRIARLKHNGHSG
ncbi:MAG: hypothetical protein WA005_14800 [Candidatus Binataceae bacterium]